MSFWLPVGIAAGVMVGLGAGLLVLMVHVQRRQARAARVEAKAASDARAVRANVRQLMDQLDGLATKIDQRIDARLIELRRVLAEVETTVAAAQEALELHDGPGPADTSSASEPGEGDSDAGPPSPTRPNPRRDEILRLRSQGLDAVEIARRVQMNVGEVELVLNLHPTGRPAR